MTAGQRVCHTALAPLIEAHGYEAALYALRELMLDDDDARYKKAIGHIDLARKAVLRDAAEQ